MTQTEAIKLAIEWIEKQPEETPDSKYDVNSRYVVIRELEALAQPEHDLYTDADKDKPDAICDGNGQVALAMCKKCGKAEIELDEPCVKPQPEQEPVAWIYESVCGNDFSTCSDPPSYAKNIRPLYTTPPQRKPLKEGEIMNIAKVSCIGISPHEDTLNFARAIEAAHGIKE